MKIIIAGSRSFSDWDVFMGHMSVLRPDFSLKEVVSGGAKGADFLGESFAKLFNVSLKIFPANWETHGKAAGIIRNKEMGNYADALIAFWDGKSNGTRHMIKYMYELNKPVHICYVET